MNLCWTMSGGQCRPGDGSDYSTSHAIPSPPRWKEEIKAPDICHYRESDNVSILYIHRSGESRILALWSGPARPCASREDRDTWDMRQRSINSLHRTFPSSKSCVLSFLKEKGRCRLVENALGIGLPYKLEEKLFKQPTNLIRLHPHSVLCSVVCNLVLGRSMRTKGPLWLYLPI